MFALLIIVIIAIIVGQAVIFSKLKTKITKFKEVFKHPCNKADNNTITFHNKANDTFIVIVTCINAYIENNGNRANDYHLMQDIVERNCDGKEEEIQSQIPTTLYLGLIGTMLGIIIGITELFSGGGLSELLAGTVQTNAIENMLKGVAVAMVASAAGITFTTVLTFIFKNAKAKNANDKNIFLSWIQANLLPSMSSDVNTALDKMSTALSDFNSQFADNTKNLNDTLSIVARTAKLQAKLYLLIKKLDIAEMAKANVKVYKALKDSTDEITYLAQMLHSSQEYVNEVRLLNESLDKSEQRTKMFEEMGNFFKSELSAVEERKKMFLNTIDEIDKEHVGQFNKLAGNFESKTENAVKEITEKFKNQNNEMLHFIARQEEIVKGSDLAKIPQEMSALDSKMLHLDKTVSENYTNLMNEITHINDKISNIQVTVPDPPETQTNLWLLIVCVAVVIASQIISAKMDYSVTKEIIFNLIFWSGIIGIIVTLVKGKK
ncbi:MAG: hypothetical protein K6F33_13475 [Bacteroidales bacterium]|nr:hypothetical protein [Bacteroidales bacterium]